MPSRLSKDDLHWFDSWAASQDVPVQLMDGDDLRTLLDKDECASVRNILRGFGVAGMAVGQPLLVPEVRSHRLPESSGLAYGLHLFLVNRGDKTARGVGLTVEHTEPRRVAYRHDESWWTEVPGGPYRIVTLNPRRLRAVRPINPGEEVSVFSIGFPAEIEPPINVTFLINAEDETQRTWCAVVSAQDIDSGRVVLAQPKTASMIETQVALGSKPTGKAAIMLLELILQNPECSSRGISLITKDLGDPTMAVFFASTGNHSSEIKGVKKREFESAVAELLSLNWLLQPVVGSGRTVFELNPDLNPA